MSTKSLFPRQNNLWRLHTNPHNLGFSKNNITRLWRGNTNKHDNKKNIATLLFHGVTIKVYYPINSANQYHTMWYKTSINTLNSITLSSIAKKNPFKMGELHCNMVPHDRGRKRLLLLHCFFSNRRWMSRKSLVQWLWAYELG